MARSVFGTCHICGENGKLSFEHVPPEAAFNDHRILRTSFDKVLASKSLDRIEGKFQQRGAGAYTLCEACNNNTGSWYAGAYADWAQQAMRIIIGTGARPSLHYPFNLFPLRVLKQVICMFFSVQSPLFQKNNSELVRFVLNRDSKDLPPSVRIYAFFTFSDRARAVGATGVLRGLGSGNSSMHLFSEITFPPFGFVLTLGDTPPPEPTFVDITDFSRFGYRDWRAGVSMRLPFKEIYTAFPGDYRNREQTLAALNEQSGDRFL